MVRGSARRTLLMLMLGVLIGSAAAWADGACEDETFCIGQHPSPTVAAATVASGSPYVHAGIDFEWPGQPQPVRPSDWPYAGPPEKMLEYLLADRTEKGYPTSRPIWPGTPNRTWALVTIWLAPTSGSAWITWSDGQNDRNYILHPGDSVTVYGRWVELSNFLVASYADEIEASEDAEAWRAGAGDYPYFEYPDGRNLIYPGHIIGTYTITVDLCGDP